MHDELLMTLIRAGGSRIESLLAEAVATHLRRTLDNGDEDSEDVAGTPPPSQVSRTRPNEKHRELNSSLKPESPECRIAIY